MTYKDLIYQALVSGETMENIMNTITKEANAAEKQKKEEDARKKAPWKDKNFDYSAHLARFKAKTITENELLDIYLGGLSTLYPDLREYDVKTLRSVYKNILKTLTDKNFDPIHEFVTKMGWF